MICPRVVGRLGPASYESLRQQIPLRRRSQICSRFLCGSTSGRCTKQRTDQHPDREANLAKVEVQEKHVQGIVSILRQLVPKANDLGLKYTSVECSIFIAEAMMQNRDRSPARQELDRALLLSDKLGMQPLSARAHHLLAVLARESGNSSDAQDHYREALRLLDGMKTPGQKNSCSGRISRLFTMSISAGCNLERANCL